jgi:hypothetical protein
MIPRFLLGLFLALVMVFTGTSTYLFISSRQSRIAVAPLKPTAVAPTPHAFVLPGTLYLEQSGALYSLIAGRFHQLTPEEGWTQPSLFPDMKDMLAVKRSGFYSNVFVLNRFGHALGALTNNAAGKYSYDTGDNHWAFYPRLSLNEATVFLSYDSPKFGYEVDLSIWQMPYNGSIRQGRIWTDINDATGYTGGDVEPIPVPSGILFTKYVRQPDGSIFSQLWFTNSAGSYGRPLTGANEACADPSMSPDFHYVAMVCSYTKQLAYLVIAPWYGSSLGPRSVIISNQFVAQPIWAPDSSGIAFLAPTAPDGPFQLWFLPSQAYFPPAPSPVPTPTPLPGGPVAPSPSPSPAPPPPVIKPIQLTTDLGFDASSPLAWAP